jgi:hypothetical protein
MAQRHWITRDEIADIFEAQGHKQVSRLVTESFGSVREADAVTNKAGELFEQAKGMREIEHLGKPRGNKAQ